MGHLIVTLIFVADKDIGFDGVVHMSEEVRKAKQSVPRAMIYTIIINGALSYAIILALLYTMDRSDDVFGSAYPIIPICMKITGSLAATNAMISGLLIMTFAVIAASLASVSRITWAWARDGGLPVWFAKVCQTSCNIIHSPQHSIALLVSQTPS